MPLLGWSEHALDGFAEVSDEKLSRFMIFYQPYTYFVLLTFARLAWCQQSLTHAFSDAPLNKWTERATLTIHWGILFGAIFSCLPWPAAIAYFVLSQATCGLLLSLVFSLNHNGMPIYTVEEAKDMDFFRKQIATGRDVNHTALITWFTGGLRSRERSFCWF